MNAESTYRELQRVARSRRRALGEILTLYALERTLARLTMTRYRETFVLKGGVLLAAYGMRRPTRDIDVTARDFHLDVGRLGEVVDALVAVEHDDGLLYDLARLMFEPIMDSAAYSGVRVTLPASLHSAQLVVRLDVSTGDAISPEPAVVTLPGLLGNDVEIVGYPLEAVIAEKSVTILQRGTTSTRWRDYMDLCDLARRYEFRGDDLIDSVQSVARHRGATLGSLAGAVAGYQAVGQPLWAAWRRKNVHDSETHADLQTQLDDVLGFLAPVFNGSASGATWSPDEYRWVDGRQWTEKPPSTWIDWPVT